MNYIEKTYDVPAQIGRRILFDSKREGIIVGMTHHLKVNFDDCKPNQFNWLHPTWRVEYLGLGKIRRLTKSQQRYKLYLDSDVSETFAEWMGFEPKQKAYNNWYTHRSSKLTKI